MTKTARTAPVLPGAIDYRALGNDTGPLTVRERQCLSLLANGRTNSGIARELSISVPTVALHLLNVRKKLNAVTREQAVAIGVARGIVSLG